MCLSRVNSHNVHACSYEKYSCKKTVKQSPTTRSFCFIKEKFCSLKMKATYTFQSIKDKLNLSEHLHILFYQITLIGTIILAVVAPTKRPWWSTINSHIMLGAQPQRNDGRKLAYLQVDAILTLQEPYELETRPFIKPVTAQQWEQLEIQRLVLNTVDLEPLSAEVMIAGYEFMKKAIENDHKVYVHCKAGEGRSATMVAVYLTLTGEYNSVNDALIFLKYKRPQVNPNKAQIEAAQRFVDSYLEEKNLIAV